MARKKRKKQGYDAEWAKAKKLCRLNAEDVRMAKEMGLKPRKLVKNRANKSEPWKAPVKVWIRELYRKRREKADRKARRRAGKPPRDEDAPPPEASHPENVSDEAIVAGQPEAVGFEGEEFAEDEPEDEFPWSDRRPGAKEIAEENDALPAAPPRGSYLPGPRAARDGRQEQFRLAAEHVARAMGELPAVEKVVAFGSVFSQLKAEVPRFREFRRAGIEILHECKNVDLAVWVSDLSCLRALQKARSGALNYLLAERDIGVAHHQVDVFMMEPGTDRYLGRLCIRSKCPKKGVADCREPGCGEVRFLRQHEGFTFDRSALERGTTLCERSEVGQRQGAARMRGETGDVESVEDDVPF